MPTDIPELPYDLETLRAELAICSRDVTEENHLRVFRALEETERLGITDADIAALAADLDQLENARAAALNANAEKVGATAGIDEAIERGMKAEIFLDALIKIVYRNDAAKLGAWKSARHVRRSDRSAPVPPS